MTDNDKGQRLLMHEIEQSVIVLSLHVFFTAHMPFEENFHQSHLAHCSTWNRKSGIGQVIGQVWV